MVVLAGLNDLYDDPCWSVDVLAGLPGENPFETSYQTSFAVVGYMMCFCFVVYCAHVVWDFVHDWVLFLYIKAQRDDWWAFEYYFGTVN